MSRAAVRVEVAVDGPAEKAFAALVDLPSQERWMVATRLYPLAGPVALPEVGSRLAALTGLAGLGVLDTMVVTSLEPPTLWTVEHTGKIIRGVGLFEVLAEGNTCAVAWTEDLELPFGILGRIGWLLLAPGVRYGLRLSLRRLARGVADGSLPLSGAAAIPSAPDRRAATSR